MLVEVSLVLHGLKVHLLKILMNCSSSGFTDLYAQTLTSVCVSQGPVLKVILESFLCPFVINYCSSFSQDFHVALHEV